MKIAQIPLTRIVLGLALVAVGVMLLLEFQGFFEFGDIWQYWPLILVVLGVAKFVQADRRDDQGTGIWLVLMGAWLLVSLQHYWDLYFRDTWPAIFVVIGLSMLWKALPPMSHRESPKEAAHE
jgi:hypothetical protein